MEFTYIILFTHLIDLFLTSNSLFVVVVLNSSDLSLQIVESQR